MIVKEDRRKPCSAGRFTLTLIIFTSVFSLSIAQNDVLLDSLKKILDNSSSDLEKCETLLEISLLRYSGDEAVSAAQEALSIARQNNWTSLIGKAYYALAWSHTYGEMEKKTLFLDSAMQAYSVNNELDGLGLVSNSRAVMFMDYQIYDQAISSFEQAYAYYLQGGDKGRQALILNNWGVCLNEMGEPHLALEKYQSALKYEVIQQPISYLKLGRIYHGLSEAHRQLGDFNAAVGYDIEAFSARTKTGNIALAETLIHMANIYCEAIDKEYDIRDISRQFKDIGFSNVMEILDKAANFPGMEERDDFQYNILDAKRRWFLVNEKHEDAYYLLDSIMRFEAQQKLNPSSLEALADLKIQYEKEKLKLRLFEGEVENQRKSDQVNMLILSLAFVASISVTGLLWYQNRIRKNSLLLAEAKQQQQIIAIRSMLEGQENERSRIARDLHDGIGNLLSSVKASISNLSSDIGNQADSKIYESAGQMIDEACSEVRKIAHEMMPQALKRLGLINALSDLVNRMNQTYAFETVFNIYGQQVELEDHSNTMIFRIVQEAFNNIVKYAGAHQVLLQLTFSAAWLNIIIEDDGVGFDLASLGQDQGMGLKSMEFRTNFMDGNYEIYSRLGEGTMISINIPIQH